MHNRTHWSSLATLIASMVFAASASAQSFPSKPIRIIAAAGAGGGVDASARIVAQNFQQALGQPGVVENRAGGGGAVGSDFVAKSAPDGHTLVAISISHAVLPSSHKNLPYSPERDLTPIAVMVNSPNILVAHPSLPVKSIRELIAYARKRPGEINYASSGNASPSHLATEYLKLLTKIDLTHVPYKGTAPGLTDVLAGRVSLMFTSIISARHHIDAGKLRVLATAGAKRAAAAPDIPTIAEAGVPGYAVDVWYALLAPSGTPRPTLEKLNQTVAKILHAPDVTKKLAAMGLEPVAENLAATDAYIKSEIRKWAPVVEAAKITSAD
ncbi:MAG: tripartite tricarboxylate transporter substrate binding protein [Betaproteobacteria bacterium]|nr:tripartite tricarboxylate transporter substrate binding protein [Betaproteobacteria bacterium]